MTIFETHCEKWENQNTAIDTDNEIKDFPTIRIQTEENYYKLATTLYKWKLEPSGNVLAVLPFGKSIAADDDFWRSPKNSDIKNEIKNEMDIQLHKIKSSDILSIIDEIKSDLYHGVIIYKYHANQWRPIEKKKSKWAYKAKVVKSDICNIQRLLD